MPDLLEFRKQQEELQEVCFGFPASSFALSAQNERRGTDETKWTHVKMEHMNWLIGCRRRLDFSLKHVTRISASTIPVSGEEVSM